MASYVIWPNPTPNPAAWPWPNTGGGGGAAGRMWACRRLLLIPPRKVLLGRPPHLFLRRRRYASDDASDTPSTEVGKKRYLYVVLEDTHEWFAIHKLDIHGDHGDKKNNNTPKRLPNPPVMRLESFPTLGYLPWFAFVGNNVIGIGSAISKLFDERDGFTMALDVKTMSLTLQRDLLSVSRTTIPTWLWPPGTTGCTCSSIPQELQPTLWRHHPTREPCTV